MDAPRLRTPRGPLRALAAGGVDELLRHAHTVTAALPLAPPPQRGVRTLLVDVAFPDGSLVLACEWQPVKAPAILVLHGVAGSSDDAYVVRAARSLSRRGYHVVRVNQRGSGRGIGKARRLYHAGLGDDVAVARRYVEQRADVTSVGVLGFSLGGHVSLCHAADVGAGLAARGKLGGVVSVSAPIDLSATLARFDENRRRPAVIYERLMVRSLVEKARALLPRGRMPFSAAELHRIKDIRTFDDVVTCRCHGFSGIPEYHEKASVGPRLQEIDVPTLALHAADDPVVPAVPLLHAERSAAVDVLVLPRGGHVGFVDDAGALWGASLAVKKAAEHFARVLS